MAVLTLTILEGRDQATLDRLHKGLAEVVMREIGAKPHQVRTIINGVRPGAYAVGGMSLATDPEALTIARGGG